MVWRGEKPTQYFHNLEKRNAKNKAWESIMDSSGNVFHGIEAVQKIQVEFYKKLYTSEKTDENMAQKFKQSITTELSQEQKDELNKNITTLEIKSSFLHNILINGLDNNQLTYWQYLALIILLYKKGIREDLANWRPLSLMNSDINSLSKAQASRVKKILPYIIHSDQKGCIVNRHWT